MTRGSDRLLLTVRVHWFFFWRHVVLTDTEFGITGLGRHRLHLRSEVGRVMYVLFAPHLTHHAFVLDRQDRLLLRLTDSQCTPNGLDRFVRALGVPATEFPDVVTRLWSGAPVYGDLEEKPGFITVTEFDQDHPGLLSKKDFRRVGESPVLLATYRITFVLLLLMFALVVLNLIFDFA